jgi:hypothetical protein
LHFFIFDILGANSFSVKAKVTTDDSGTDNIALTGVPDFSDCGNRPSIPASSVGLVFYFLAPLYPLSFLLSSTFLFSILFNYYFRFLRTFFKFGESIMLVSFNNPGEFFPPEGPYTVQVGGDQFTVTAASCPRYLVLLISFALFPSLLLS